MTLFSVALKPGPQRIAAAMALAGFSENVTYPDITDALGKVWTKPSALLIATAIAGAESSGHAWVYRVNNLGTPQESTDYGLMEVNSTYNAQFYGPVKSPTQDNWARYDANCHMAYEVWEKAREARLSAKGPATDDFKPWHSYPAGIVKVRWTSPKNGPHTWLDWAQSGITELHKVLVTGATLGYAASIDLDPLELSQHPLIY